MVDPLTLSLIVAWAVVRAMAEAGWFGVQAARELPARRRRALDAGYDPSPGAAETRPWTWDRVFRRRAEGRPGAAALWAIGALASGLLSPFVHARDGWRAGWREQRERIAAGQDWASWWGPWWEWWRSRERFARAAPEDGGNRDRGSDDGPYEDVVHDDTEHEPGGHQPPPRPDGSPPPDDDYQVDVTVNRRPPWEPTPLPPTLPARLAVRRAAPNLGTAVRPSPGPSPAIGPPSSATTTLDGTTPQITTGGEPMSSDIATRDDGGTTATRGDTTVAAGPASGSHRQAKDIGEAIVKRIAKRLNAINDLRDNINADMTWIAGQLSDLEAAGIGGDSVSLWWDALMDGDVVHATGTTLANQIAAMHDSARTALRRQAHTGDTVSNVIAKVGEENVAANTDYYKD